VLEKSFGYVFIFPAPFFRQYIKSDIHRDRGQCDADYSLRGFTSFNVHSIPNFQQFLRTDYSDVRMTPRGITAKAGSVYYGISITSMKEREGERDAGETRAKQRQGSQQFGALGLSAALKMSYCRGSLLKTNTRALRPGSLRRVTPASREALNLHDLLSQVAKRRVAKGRRERTPR